MKFGTAVWSVIAAGRQTDIAETCVVAVRNSRAGVTRRAYQSNLALK